MKCPKCGNDKFYAHQQVYVDIVVNEHNEFAENAHEDISTSIYESGKPYGPYRCTKCHKEYDELI